MKAVAVFAVFGLCVCAASASYGQTTQPRQAGPGAGAGAPEDSPQPLGKARRLYRALFGGANTGQRRETILSFSGSVFEVYSQEEVDEGEPALDGLYTNLTGTWTTRGTAPAWRLRRRAVAAFAITPRLSQVLAVEYHAGVGVQARVAPQTTMFVRQSARYGPVGLPILFAEPLPPELGDPLPPDSDFAVTDDKVVTSLTLGSFERGILGPLAARRECQLPVQRLPRGEHTDQRLFDARQRCRLPLPIQRARGASVWVTTTAGRATTCPRRRVDEDHSRTNTTCSSASQSSARSRIEQRTLAVVRGRNVGLQRDCPDWSSPGR